MKSKPKLDPTQAKSELRRGIKNCSKNCLKNCSRVPTEAQERVKIHLPATSKKPKRKQIHYGVEYFYTETPIIKQQKMIA